MSEKVDFGHVVSLKEAMLSETPQEDKQDQQQTLMDMMTEVWSYQHLGRIRGVPVNPGDLGLPVAREDLLDVAFYLKVTPKSKIFWISPEEVDSIKLYDDLLALQSDKQIQILDELKQYDASKGKFMVWVRYDEQCYALDPRFEFLRKELK